MTYSEPHHHAFQHHQPRSLAYHRWPLLERGIQARHGPELRQESPYHRQGVQRRDLRGNLKHGTDAPS